VQNPGILVGELTMTVVELMLEMGGKKVVML